MGGARRFPFPPCQQGQGGSLARAQPEREPLLALDLVRRLAGAQLSHGAGRQGERQLARVN